MVAQRRRGTLAAGLQRHSEPRRARYGGPANSRLSAIFESVALDERILAVGLCDEGGRLLNPTKLMPTTFSCDKVARSEAESFSTIINDGRRILVGAFPIVERNQKSYLVMLHGSQLHRCPLGTSADLLSLRRWLASP